MKAVVYHRHGTTDELNVEERPEPELRSGDALVQVAATSLNGFDPMMLAGSTSLRTPMPMVPCGDFAGRILGFGEGTDCGRWKVGDRVCPHPFVIGEGMTGETRTGAACERVRIPVSNLIEIPHAVSDVQAASLPIAYGTAYRMMVTRGAPTDIRYIWTYEQRILGSNGWTPDEQRSLMQLVADGDLEPVIDSVVPLEGLRDAMQSLIDRRVFGKIVIEPQA